MMLVEESKIPMEEKVSLWLIHENTGHLIGLLAHYWEVSSREGLDQFLTSSTRSLAAYVIDESSDAFVEVFYAALLIDRFLREKEERLREEALFHLTNIRRLLELDQLFGMPEAVPRRRHSA